MNIYQMRMLQWRVALLWLIVAAFGGCSAPGRQPPSRHEIVVLAAASLTDAFEAAAGTFMQQSPDTHVTFNFAGSQQLAQQIVNGAPADIFASANLAQMEAVIAAGKIEVAAVRPFARNRLVVVTPADNPAAINALADLAAPGNKLVLADSAVPAGRYALDMLDKAATDPAIGADFPQRVRANVVSYEDNVRAVLTKVLLGEADAGIVYASDAYGRTGAATDQGVTVIDIPDTLNVVVEYPLAVVADSAQPAAAAAFVDFLLSPVGQTILQAYGFQPIQDGSGQ